MKILIADDLFTAQETAGKLGFSEATFWRLVREGLIATIKFGGRTLVTKEELARLKPLSLKKKPGRKPAES